MKKVYKKIGFYIIIIVIATILTVPFILADKKPQETNKFGFGFKPNEKNYLIPGKDYVPGELIVGYITSSDIPLDEVLSQIDAICAKYGGKRIKQINGAALYKFPSDIVVEEAVMILVKSPLVRYVERNGIMKIMLKPNL